MTLDQRLRGRPFEQIPLQVTSGVLLHIGAGIYNSVAGAIKELVSNSFDADATRVVINTHYPDFDQVTVTDNGSGMSASQFAIAMQNIGSSLKGALQPSRLTPLYQRPVIGHMGIGLMALTQVCGTATIESQEMDANTKFVAELDFTDFRERKQQQMETAKIEVFRRTADAYGGLEGMRTRLDELAPDSDEYLRLLAQYDLAVRASEIVSQRGIEDLEKEHLGYCVLYAGLPAVPGEHGTIVRLNDIDAGVRASLIDCNRSKDGMPQNYQDRTWSQYRDEVNEWSWRELCERLRLRTNQLSYHSLPQYHQFLWELSIMTPVPYFSDGPVTLAPTVLEAKRRELVDFDFSVLVDNRPLVKGSLLPSGTVARQSGLEEGYDYLVETTDGDHPEDGDRLRYEGYIYWQRRQNEPSSLRGIQVYIRNTGIGLYDQTLMGFSQVNPSSRAGQMSGEIYVEEGLERALNVDRNSFRETDAHFLALRDHLWRVIGSARRGDGIIGKSIEAYWRRKTRQNEQGRGEHVRTLSSRVQAFSGGKFELEFSDEENPAPYIVQKDRIIVYDGSPRWPRSVPDRQRSQELLVAVRSAIGAGASPQDVMRLLEDMLLR